MKYSAFIAALLICFLTQGVFAVDNPTGFASVSGKGLTTTTGGAGGQIVTVTTFSDLQKFASDTLPYIILVKGKLDATTKGATVNVASNKTIVGLDTNATLYQGELHLINVSNVIIRNLVIRDSYVEGDYDGKSADWDAIQVDSSHHIWIDHCHLTHNCDGLIDLRKACDYVTVSWVHFSNHNKAFGIGWTTETDFRTTIDHCWFDSTNQRNPSFDMGIGHMYNNYISKVTSYGNYARGKARLVIENSVFSGAANATQYDDSATLYLSGLQFTDCTGTNTGNTSTPPFNPQSYYSYTLDQTSKVKALVTDGAGTSTLIGNQYLSTPVTTNGTGASTENTLLKVISGNSSTLTINTYMPGQYTISIVSPRGQTIGKLDGYKTSVVSCKLPAKGVYLVSLYDKTNILRKSQLCRIAY